MDKTALSLHPDNPHYFYFRGEPTVLITSGEHYASVLNLDFDFRKYLDTLHSERLNHARIFTGVYREPLDEYWPGNPLGPQPNRFVCPFRRSSVPGAVDGGCKFDLETWDEGFFSRLKDFCRCAGDYGIVIEMNLFCPFYIGGGDRLGRWNLSPWHQDNNINDLGVIPPSEIFSLKHRKLQKYQDAMVRRIVRDLNPLDNLYFEICNEPYIDGAALEWQHHIAELIVEEEERGLPLRKQLGILKDFVFSFDFVRMAPDNSVIENKGNAAAVYVLAEQGRQYGVYVLCEEGGSCRSIMLNVPDSRYSVQFVDVFDGAVGKPEMVEVKEGPLTVELPAYRRDIAVRVLAVA